MRSPRSLQPYEGSSETPAAPATRRRYLSLQPHEGSSETCQDVVSRTPVFRFNPTRVRLKPPTGAPGAASRHSFNPTRVRLKHQRVDLKWAFWSLQPHEGSSETTCGETFPTDVGMLQPHEGSSETPQKPDRANSSRASTPRGFV